MSKEEKEYPEWFKELANYDNVGKLMEIGWEIYCGVDAGCGIYYGDGCVATKIIDEVKQFILVGYCSGQAFVTELLTKDEVDEIVRTREYAPGVLAMEQWDHEQRREGIIRDYSRGDIQSFRQIDGWINAGKYDSFFPGDKDNDSIQGSRTEELRRSGKDLAVRVLIHEDTDFKDAMRLLRKILEGLEAWSDFRTESRVNEEPR